jgi:hypothetical protein
MISAISKKCLTGQSPEQMYEQQQISNHKTQRNALRRETQRADKGYSTGRLASIAAAEKCEQ